MRPCRSPRGVLLGCALVLLALGACGGSGGADADGWTPDGSSGAPDAADVAAREDAGSGAPDTPAGGEDAALADDSGGWRDVTPADAPAPADTAAAHDTTGDDAGAPVGGPTIVVAPLEGWQRGPVSVRFALADAALPALVTVSFRPAAGGAWQPAAALTGYGDPLDVTTEGERRFVWDSFADAWTDAPVELRLTVEDAAGGTGEALVGPLDLRNDPDRPRVVLLTSAINGNDKLRRLRWHHGDGLSWDGNVTQVGRRPNRAVFGPGGRAAAVLEDENDAQGITFLGFTADGGESRRVRLATPTVNPADAVYAGDAAALYVVSFDSTADAGVYRIDTDPANGLPAAGARPVRIYERTVAGELALRPDGEGLLVYGGTMMDERGDLRLDVIRLDGTVVDRVYFGGNEFGFLAAGLALSPDGRWALAGGHSLFADEDQVALFAVGGDGHLEERDTAPVSDPADIAFHESSQVALLSEAEAGNVLPLVITPDGRLDPGARLRVSLAEQMAHTEEGADRDRVLVTSVSASTGVSSVVVVRLDETGVATRESALDLGGGIDVLPAALAIQP
jgi:hypothetical protein